MENLVAIASFDFRAEADYKRMLLEENGIKAFLADDNLIGMDWFLSNAVGGVKLQVAASDVDLAREILGRNQAANAETKDESPGETITFNCQECGRLITFPADRRGHTETCPECSDYVDVPDNTDVAPDCGTIEPANTIELDSRTNGQLWIEVAAVLCLAYLPVLYWALMPSYSFEPADYFSVQGILYDILTTARVAIPLLLILALSKGPWSLFGIVRPKWIADAFVGCLVWFCAVLARDIAKSLLPVSMLAKSTAMQEAYQTRPDGMCVSILLLVGIAVMACCEELVFRGYLIARFERLLHSKWIAVVVSAVMFSSVHAYQGPRGLASAAAAGLVYGTAFCLCRRLWPICVAHAFHNLMIVF